MSFQNRNLQIDEACSTRRCIAVFVEPIGTCAPFGLMYGACRGGNNQPTHHVTPQAIQKMLNAPPNHLKDPFLGPYTTSHRDFKSPRVPAKIGSSSTHIGQVGPFFAPPRALRTPSSWTDAMRPVQSAAPRAEVARTAEPARVG